ncbi:TolC family protein [Capnocytophaga catalasegens]|uniref:Outer membrane efflux protein n=1 Tax=Capnocytophaga catalasegens TaxID=1004260 RepID=A0AAV5AUS1_9FLAO|nr:TolC family protein [Capnocytophaga catalasegens]GIZ16487.1 hypothetical protein RCZ03_24870 [Capnocytophaga catalasegens]GJM50274.1 hypothetical protein RCZ15_12470 [Capnocytophaga catalasegens]GJM53791.1 hypothetical protein RCZ16_21070 [Capnocytophaga catalasegens]
MLEQCLDYALKNNIQVKKTQLSQQSAQINLNQAKNNRLPSVNGSVSANMNNGLVINQITNQRGNQTAWQNVTIRQAQQEASKTACNNAKLVYELASKKFEFDSLTSTELAVIRNSYLNAEQTYLQIT